ncbi:hypothetical protein [Nocardia sp. BMG51109]|uniref:hypothetical protein n=1 Tax=Nocardia sp. BMG51109 TaxID=1056816 RepID=UPI0006840C0A|nr:hypothetical protein [Nocardia sp. BMG51109]
MIDPIVDAVVVPEVVDDPLSSPSTPLHRAASRLQEVLPSGWRVAVAEPSVAVEHPARPVLRVHMPED